MWRTDRERPTTATERLLAVAWANVSASRGTNRRRDHFSIWVARHLRCEASDCLARGVVKDLFAQPILAIRPCWSREFGQRFEQQHLKGGSEMSSSSAKSVSSSPTSLLNVDLQPAGADPAC